MNSYLEKFIDAYVQCALWSTHDEEMSCALDCAFNTDDIAPEAMEAMREQCARFVVYTGLEDRPNWTPEQAGHDFWLTRNGHGAGFWDRGQPDGEELAARAAVFGPSDMYVGDDGKVYVS